MHPTYIAIAIRIASCKVFLLGQSCVHVYCLSAQLDLSSSYNDMTIAKSRYMYTHESTYTHNLMTGMW